MCLAWAILAAFAALFLSPLYDRYPGHFDFPRTLIWFLFLTVPFATGLWLVVRENMLGVGISFMCGLIGSVVGVPAVLLAGAFSGDGPGEPFLLICFLIFVVLNAAIAILSARVRSGASNRAGFGTGCLVVLLYMIGSIVVGNALENARDKRSSDATRNALDARKQTFHIASCAIREIARTGQPPHDLVSFPVFADCTRNRIMDAFPTPGYQLTFETSGPHFRLQVVPKKAGTETFLVDDTGLVQETRGKKLFAVPTHGPMIITGLQRCLEDSKKSYGAYPANLVSMGPQGKNCIPLDSHNQHPTTLESNTFEYQNMYTVTYSPIAANGRAPHAYTLSATCLRYGDYCLRSLLLDERGIVHGTGENRPARTEDPPSPACELSEWKACDSGMSN